MPLSFFNGGVPDYLGELFTSKAELLNKIKDNLVLAGWTAHLDDIIANNRLVMKGTSANNHNCWVDFRVTVVSATEERLWIRGDQTGAGTILSPDELYMQFFPGGNNYLYLTADADSGCLGIFPTTHTMRSCHFGFLDRIQKIDQWAWMVGYLYGVHHRTAFVAKHFNDLDNWNRIGYEFALNNNPASASQSGAFQGTFDRYTTAVKPNSTFDNASATTEDAVSKRNQAYQAYLGAINQVNNLPVLSDYFYLEGKWELQHRNLWFRGVVKHAVTGVASLNPGVQVLAADGSRYLSGGTQGWQGFKVL